MYSFNEPTLTEALIRAKDWGVSMRVILDALQAGNSTSLADALKKAGVTAVPSPPLSNFARRDRGFRFSCAN